MFCEYEPCKISKCVSPVANVTKLFTVVSYAYAKKAREFVPVKPFQPSLMFSGKAGAYLSEAPFRCSTQGEALGLTHEH
jgi:hypothetical protein